MDGATSDKIERLRERLIAFMDDVVYPNERVYHDQLDAADDRWTNPPVMEDMKTAARDAGLWNLFPAGERVRRRADQRRIRAAVRDHGAFADRARGVSTARRPTPATWRCSPRYGTTEQQEAWLKPLLAGEIRSGFAMTEPDVASSDATNIQASIDRDGDDYVLNGRKWWTSGAGDKRCKILIFMGKTDTEAARHLQQSMILVPIDTSGVNVLRHLPVFGYDDAPHGHCEIDFENVRVPGSNMLLGEGRGFEIAQGRLGPGRIHHCMRLVGLAETVAGGHVPARARPGRVRQTACRTGRGDGADREFEDRDRPSQAAHHECRPNDGYRRQQGRAR